MSLGIAKDEQKWKARCLVVTELKVVKLKWGGDNRSHLWTRSLHFCCMLSKKVSEWNSLSVLHSIKFKKKKELLVSYTGKSELASKHKHHKPWKGKEIGESLQGKFLTEFEAYLAQGMGVRQEERVYEDKSWRKCH